MTGRATTIALALCMGLMAVTAQADVPAVRANCTNNSEYECGWWWYMNHKDDDEDDEEQTPVVVPDEPANESSEPERPDKLDCTDPGQWKPSCGFIDPGDDFEFQSQQRDALMKHMVMHPVSPDAVRGFQEYTKWVFDRAIAVGRMWKWNMVQDPELDPMQATPVSHFGLQLLRQEDKHRNVTAYRILKEQGAFLVYFTRSDCDYCHAEQPVIELLQKDSGLDVYNAALDDTCLDAYTGDKCMTAPETIRPARILNVKTVPALFIYLPNDDQWIRLASGVATADKLESRIRLFVGAIQAANENAVVNASESGVKRPSVDFRTASQIKELSRYGLGEGVAPLQDSSDE